MADLGIFCGLAGVTIWSFGGFVLALSVDPDGSPAWILVYLGVVMITFAILSGLWWLALKIFRG